MKKGAIGGILLLTQQAEDAEAAAAGMRILCIALGIFTIGFALFNILRMRLTCTEEVTATCVDVIMRKGRKSPVFAPVWKYYYNGTWYRTEDPVATSFSFVYGKGDECTLYINPRNPEKIRRKGSVGEWVILLVGAAFIAFGIFLV